MKTQTIHTDEMTLWPLFGRLNSRRQHVMKTPSIAVISVLLVTLLFALPGFAQVIQNPSFEQPVLGPPFQSTGPVPGWTHSGAVGDDLLWAIGASNGQVTVAGAGNQFVTLGGGISGPGTASWTQTIRGLVPGDNYILGFKVANEGEAPSQTMTATVTVGKTILATGAFTTTCGYGLEWWQCWEQENLGFTATRGLATLTFTVTNQMYDMGLDAITITRVPATGGKWTPLNNPPSFHTGTALLLTDGTVLAHEESDQPSDNANYANWWRLTPDAYGSYINGTWSKVPSTLPSPYGPLFFASAVLPDSRAIAEGGEYNNASPADTTLGAIFENDPKNPNFNKWASVLPPNWGTIGDAQSVVLPDGTFMLANCCTEEEAEMTAPYLGGSSWIPTGTFKHDLNDEEGWTLLPGPPDAEVLLTVDASVLGGSTCGPTGSEMYINGLWFCIANTPTQLWDNASHELGPAVLRPDGTVFQAGGTNQSGSGQSAIFDSGTFTWKAGPNFPPNLDVADGPAALLPNGNVLVMASPGLFTAPASFYTLQYGTNTLVKEVTSPQHSSKDSSEEGHMLVLPTGQIYFADFQDVEIYTPTDQLYTNSWVPVLQDINSTPVASCFGHITTYPPPPCLTISQGTTNTLDGFQLNGLSQGAAYGDDFQDATNYPLVSITQELFPGWCIVGQSCPQPLVYYCRTHDHSNMGVATGNLLVSTKFECPNVPIGFKGYLDVVANGIGGGGIPVIVGP